jgi:alpha-tubulin suppressor-like RCC1 family protein
MDGLENVRGITSGVNRNLAVTQSGAVFSWGESRLLGPEDALRPVTVEGFGEVRVRRVCAGRYTAFAIGEAGELFSRGFGGGEFDLVLGNGAWQNQLSPKRVEALRGVRVNSAAVGTDHARAGGRRIGVRVG